MEESSRPESPGRRSSKLMIVGILVAVLAVAAVAGAYVLMSSGSGTPGGTNQDNNSGDNNQTNGNGNNNGSPFQLKNGEFMVYTTTTSAGGMDFTASMRWEISNVTSLGYDVEVTFTSDMGSSKYKVHANYSDTLGVGGDDADYDKGVKVGTETLSTAFGNKKVEHWRTTDTTDGETTVTDYYVGVDTPVMYKMVVAMTNPSDPTFDGTTTTVLSDTNIDAIKTGNT